VFFHPSNIETMANLPQRQRRQAAQRWIDNIFSKPGTSANLLRQPKSSVLLPKAASKSTATPSGVDADGLESKAGASNSFGGDAEVLKLKARSSNSFGDDVEVLKSKAGASTSFDCDVEVLESKAGASNSFGDDVEVLKSKAGASNSFGDDVEVLESKAGASTSFDCDVEVLESKAGASNYSGGDAEVLKLKARSSNSFGDDVEVLKSKVVASDPPVDASARGLLITQEEDQKIKLVNIGSSFGICLSLDQNATRIVLPKGIGISGMTACFDTADFNSGQARLLFRELGIDDCEHTLWACLFNFLGKDEGGNSLPPSVAMNLPFVGPCTIELKADGSLLSLGSFHLVGFVTAVNKCEGTTQDMEVNRLSDKSQRSILTSNGIISSRIRDKITRVVKPRNYSHSSLTWILIMVSAMLLLLGQWGNGGESGSVSPSLRPQSRPPSTTRSTRQMKDAVPASPSLPGSLRTLQGPAPLPTFTPADFTVSYLNC
jgi:hypothetical protein